MADSRRVDNKHPANVIPFVKSFTKTNAAKVRREAESGMKQVLDRMNSTLYTVEARIHEQVRAFDPGIEGYVAYAIRGHGKRLRPALVLLAAEATGGVRQPNVELAVILELIHLATLVHDDIMDGAELRRNRPTANAKWGSAISVLLGDCLFAHALMLATQFKDREVTRRIALAANDVCTGEILQTQRRYDLQLTIAEYHRIIEMKTAALFGAATELTGLLNECDPRQIVALRNYGLRLGSAYQIYDDCLDIAGDEEAAGKSLGTDLKKGKFTLPVLLLLQNTPADETEQIHELILRNGDGAAELAQRVQEAGALAGAVRTGRKLVREALDELDHLVPGPALEDLRRVGESVNLLLAQFEV